MYLLARKTGLGYQYLTALDCFGADYWSFNKDKAARFALFTNARNTQRALNKDKQSDSPFVDILDEDE